MAEAEELDLTWVAVEEEAVAHCSNLEAEEEAQQAGQVLVEM